MDGKILVVDDDPSTLVLIEKMLEASYEVITASRGQDALDVIEDERGKIKLVILDLSMPPPNGPQVFLAIREKFPYLEHKVIFITGGMFGHLVDTLKISDERCLEKPLDKQKLLEVVNHLFYL